MKLEVKKGKAIVQHFNEFTTIISVYIGDDEFFNQQFKMIERTNNGNVEYEAVDINVLVSVSE